MAGPKNTMPFNAGEADISDLTFSNSPDCDKGVEAIHSNQIPCITVLEKYICRLLNFFPKEGTYLGPSPLLHSHHPLPTLHEEVGLPAGRGRLGHFAPKEPLLSTDQHIWVRRVTLLLSFNLISEVLTDPLHSGLATKVRVRLPKIAWVDEREGEESEEVYASREEEEQQGLVHGLHHLESCPGLL